MMWRVEMGKSHTINKENLFKNRGGNRGGTDRGGPRPPASYDTYNIQQRLGRDSID